MNVICKNPKNYNITLEKNYNVIEQDNDYFIIENDLENVEKYHKNLFEWEKEQLSDQEILDSINVQYVARSGRYARISRENKEGEHIIKDIALDIDYSESIISCGIGELAGINNLANVVNRIELDIQDRELESKARDYIFKEIIRQYVEILNTKITLLSTNITHNDERINRILSEMYTNVSTYNYNSGNEIKLWIAIQEKNEYADN